MRALRPATEGEHDNGILNPETAEFQKQVDEFLALRNPTVRAKTLIFD